MNRQLNVVIASNNWSELKFKFKFKSRMFAKYVTQKGGWNFSGPKTTLQNQVQVKPWQLSVYQLGGLSTHGPANNNAGSHRWTGKPKPGNTLPACQGYTQFNCLDDLWYCSLGICVDHLYFTTHMAERNSTAMCQGYTFHSCEVSRTDLIGNILLYPLLNTAPHG